MHTKNPDHHHFYYFTVATITTKPGQHAPYPLRVRRLWKMPGSRFQHFQLENVKSVEWLRTKRSHAKHRIQTYCRRCLQINKKHLLTAPYYIRERQSVHLPSITEEACLHHCWLFYLSVCKGSCVARWRKGSSFDIAPLTILDSGALQPRKWQLIGTWL